MFTQVEDERLREVLKRCSPSTYEAARRFRQTGDPAHLPAIIHGVIQRYMEPDRRAALTQPDDGLRLVEDLGIDSLTMMEIVMLAEDVLQITVTGREMCQLRTLGDAKRFIEGKVLDRARSLAEAAVSDR
ncbi:MAG: hypothetical protein A3G75_12040 [Verrucomicrobia bacterium RIFCSPLOWO2_12_FULL_64_8]|nr:MAG: hypothetical protein A3G75_12040 [Verrucomicrobia bacterium RIFCSPLOWO2_12_FULL_64_8]